MDQLVPIVNTKGKKTNKTEGVKEDGMNEEEKDMKCETEGVVMEALGAAWGPESTTHTTLENLHLDVKVLVLSFLFYLISLLAKAQVSFSD